MELRTYLLQVWKYALLLILVVFISTAFAFVYTSNMTKVYTAESRLVVTAGLGTSGASAGNLELAPRVGMTYAILATTRPILIQTIERAKLPFDPEELLRHLSVAASPDAPFLGITATDESPDRAAAIANALADVLIEIASAPPTGAEPTQSILAVVEAATSPNDPSSPRVLLTTILAGAVALIISLLILGLWVYLREDPAIKRTTNG